MRRLKKIAPWLAGILLGAAPGLAFAAGAGTLGQVQNSLQGSILPWQHTMQMAATDLFYVLAAVEFSVLFLNHVLQKRGHEDLFAGIIKKVVTLGFFLTLLDNSGTWIPDIIDGLAGGAQALGVTQVSPGAIATDALKVFMELVESPFRAASHAAGHSAGNVFSDIWSLNFSGAVQSAATTLAAANPLKILIEELMMVIIGLLAGLGILVMALEFLMVQIESYLVIALGVVMLAGGGLRWTSKYVGSYFDYAINVGVRLFVLTALAFLVTDSITLIMEKILQNITNPLQSGFEAVILGAVIALLPRKASSIASSLLSGNSSFSGGELVKEGGIIAGGTVAAGAGVAALGVGAAGGLAAGGLSAAAGAGGAGSLAGGGLAGAAGAGEAGAAAGVAAPEAGAMSAGGGASSGAGAGNAVPAPSAGGSAGGEAAQASRAVQAPATSTQSTGQQNPSKGVEAPIQEAGKEAGQDKQNDQGMSASEPHPDAPPVPVNAVPAPEPVSTPSGGGGGGQGSKAAPAQAAPDAPGGGGATMDDVVEQLKQMQGQPKGLADKVKEGFAGRSLKHVEEIATAKSNQVQKSAIDTSHPRDFD
ncbi:P-type conjugative transfer protein TrbL [Acidithiobacillus ferrivorans]|uniref:P-type conjugative transfer protein TrbL n=1 Tax=Acidithiobacillus ferrivorans TaxID=160808 RepID=UPI001E349768|nr:P-type conjugative transfer protein TrbL [Acidithiobacillus ferrivorans]